MLHCFIYLGPNYGARHIQTSLVSFLPWQQYAGDLESCSPWDEVLWFVSYIPVRWVKWLLWKSALSLWISLTVVYKISHAPLKSVSELKTIYPGNLLTVECKCRTKCNYNRVNETIMRGVQNKKISTITVNFHVKSPQFHEKTLNFHGIRKKNSRNVLLLSH